MDKFCNNARISNKFKRRHLWTKFASYKVPPVMVSTHGSVVPLAMFCYPVLLQDSCTFVILFLPHPVTGLLYLCDTFGNTTGLFRSLSHLTAPCQYPFSTVKMIQARPWTFLYFGYDFCVTTLKTPFALTPPTFGHCPNSDWTHPPALNRALWGWAGLGPLGPIGENLQNHRCDSVTGVTTRRYYRIKKYTP